MFNSIFFLAFLATLFGFVSVNKYGLFLSDYVNINMLVFYKCQTESDDESGFQDVIEVPSPAT